MDNLTEADTYRRLVCLPTSAAGTLATLRKAHGHSNDAKTVAAALKTIAKADLYGNELVAAAALWRELKRLKKGGPIQVAIEPCDPTWTPAERIRVLVPGLP